VANENQEKKRTIFPIKYKFFVALFTIFLVFLISFLYYTINLFLSDKEAYVYETSLGHVETQGAFLEKFLSTTYNQSELLYKNLKHINREAQLEILQAFSNQTKEFSLYDEFTYEDNSFVNTFSFVAPHLEKNHPNLRKLKRFHRTVNRELHDLLKNAEPGLTRVINEEKVYPYFYVAIMDHQARKAYVFRFLIENIFNEVFKNSQFSDMLFDSHGEILFHSQSNEDNEKSFIAYKRLVEEIFDKDLGSGVKKVVKATGGFLVSFKQLKQFEIATISEVSESQAFSFAKLLVTKAIIFGAISGCIILIVSLLFSQTITYPLRKLLSGTKDLSEGNFERPITLRSGDELENLAQAFDGMRVQIRDYMKEVVEKGRMESELELAKSVQDSFMPDNHIKFGDATGYGYYESASECGGDWWNIESSHDKLYLFIGDATGHGVPAALMTATASCCSQTMLDYFSRNEDHAISAAELMSYLNRTIAHASGGKILMTFFIAIFDPQDMTIEYCNASHNPPLLYRHSDDEPSKGDIEILADKIGKRLGDKLGSEYENVKISVSEQDVILLYTDGIVEGMNPEGKMFGDRRFMKSFYTRAKQHPKDIIDGLLKDGNNFFEGVEPDDDITLVSFRFVKTDLKPPELPPV